MPRESTFDIKKSILQQFGIPVEGMDEAALDKVFSSTALGDYSKYQFMELKVKDGYLGYHNISYKEFIERMKALPEDKEAAQTMKSQFRIVDFVENRGVRFENGGYVPEDDPTTKITDFNREQQKKALNEKFNQYPTQYLQKEAQEVSAKNAIETLQDKKRKP